MLKVISNQFLFAYRVGSSACSRDSRPRDWSRLGAIFLVSVSPNISRDSRDWDQPYILVDICNAKVAFELNMSLVTINCKNGFIRRLKRNIFFQCIVTLDFLLIIKIELSKKKVGRPKKWRNKSKYVHYPGLVVSWNLVKKRGETLDLVKLRLARKLQSLSLTVVIDCLFLVSGFWPP